MVRTAFLVAAVAALLGSAGPVESQVRRPRVAPCPPPVVVSGPAATAPAAEPAADAGGSTGVYDEVRRRADLADVKEYNLFRAATPPLKLARSLPEWERARYLILATPEPVLADKEVFQTIAEIIRHAVDVTDVLVLLDGRRPDHLKRFVKLLGEADLADKLAPAFGPGSGPPAGRIHAVQVEVDTMWVRDYGPTFATTAAGKLCILDSMYRDLRLEQRSAETGPKMFGLPAGRAVPGAGLRPNDERLPTVLATALGNRFLGEPVAVVRAPLQLAGGDFFADGAGTGFSSTDTLMENGGDEAWVNRLFREYYGVPRMVYLEALPGATIKHLDMFFRPVDANTFLLAEYPTDVPASSPYYSLQHQETHRTLERNTEILRARFPAARVVRVPMPALSFPADRAAMVQSSRAALERADIDPDDFGDDPDALIGRALDLGPEGEPRAKRMIRQVTAWRHGKAVEKDEFDLRQDLRAADQEYFKILDRRRAGASTSDDARRERELTTRIRQLEDAIREAVRGAVPLYHTYLNALHLKGSGREKVLVPSYKAYDRMEEEVARRFRSAYPAAEVVFVPADRFVKEMGAVHCMTCVIPDHRPAAAGR